MKRDKSKEKTDGQYAREQVATSVSRTSCWGRGEGGIVTRLEGVDIVKEGRRTLLPSAS
jgi:hypothetical protein